MRVAASCPLVADLACRRQRQSRCQMYSPAVSHRQIVRDLSSMQAVRHLVSIDCTNTHPHPLHGISMDFRIHEADAHEIREEAIDFFWRLRSWGSLSRLEDYRSMWDWRYTRLAEGRPRVWVARADATNEVVGHLAVYPRRLRYGDQILSAIVPGNFVVHRDYRNTLIGPRLAMQPRSVVRRGEAELVVAFGNEAAHMMFSRQGYIALGGFAEYRYMTRWGPTLGRRFRPAALLGPAVDAAFALRRRRLAPAVPAGLVVRELDSAAVNALDLRHWAPSTHVESGGSGAYLAGRFLADPFVRRRLFGIFDEKTGRIEAYVAVTAEPASRVWECRTNPDRLDIPAATVLVALNLPGTESLSVSMLAASEVAPGFTAHGLLRRPSSAYEASRQWSVYVPNEHSLAEALKRPERWALFLGSTHY